MIPSINRHSRSIINDFICFLQEDKWIVVTTIFYPTKAIIEQQNILNFRILHYLRYGSYARKNLGYLIVIKYGAKIIFESDDDNLLETNDIYLLPKIVQQKHLDIFNLIEINPPIALEPFTFSPYNTQNTITYYEAFWGLYLPITTRFRVCDIWRNFWIQRFLWDIGGRLIFGKSSAKQVRNSHSFIKDMDDEYQLYHQSGSFVSFLVSWSSSYNLISKGIAQLAKDIAQAGFWQSNKVDIMDAWLTDLHSVGYSFPSIVQTPSSSPASIVQKRAAICVTGLAECIQEAWAPT
ncbi:unnamed protein product [Rotaria sp. Silwood1]|nr:unnamed protein product [Rotaria sp. Silwood1]